MSTIQFKSNYSFYKSATLKPIAIAFLYLLFCSNLNAQKGSSFKLKAEAGTLILLKPHKLLLPDISGPPGTYGVFIYVEPKLKSSENTFIGLRMGATIVPHSQFYSIAPTFDYYFKNKEVPPYVGIGLGYYFLNTHNGLFDPANMYEESVANKAGLLLRGGYDYKKFSVGLEFNYIPQAEVIKQDGQVLEKVDNSFIGLSIGYTIVERKNS